MTYALVLIKGKPDKRESSLKLLEDLEGDRKFVGEHGVEIQEVLISFGWPDFILILKSKNVELIKQTIVFLREKASENGDDMETSTIICTTQEEMDQKIEKWRGSIEC